MYSPAMRRLLMTVLGAGAAAGLTACEPVTATTIGLSVARSGAALYTSGKIFAVRMADFEDCVEAVRHAAEALALTFEEEDISEQRAFLNYEDDRGHDLIVVIRRRTAVLTDIRVDVGFTGSEPLARLFLAQVEDRLLELEGAEGPVGEPAFP